MNKQIIKENDNYVKVNNCFVINKNDKEYHAALIRRRNDKRIEEIEKRVSDIETKLDLIISILKEKA
jgi:hypothetical protein